MHSGLADWPQKGLTTADRVVDEKQAGTRIRRDIAAAAVHDIAIKNERRALPFSEKKQGKNLSAAG